MKKIFIILSGIFVLSINCIYSATYSVTSLSNTGTGTLRDCITQANANSGHDTIKFNVSGTITITSALPALTDNAGVTIDGFKGTAAGTPNSVSVFGGTLNPVYNITLKSTSINQCFTITSDNNVIRGLCIESFASGASTWDDIAIYINGGNYNKVLGCYLGMNKNGSIIGGSVQFSGVRINGNYNQVGDGTAAGINLISGNSYTGVYIYGSNIHDNIIKGNRIGLQANGTAIVSGGSQDAGVDINDSGYNNIIEGNVISGNTNRGIGLNSSHSSGNKVYGNYIGCSADGTASIAYSNQTRGVYITDSPNNQIGGTNSSQRNIISGNTSYGIFYQGSTSNGNKIHGNYVGTNKDGNAILTGTTGQDHGVGVSYSSPSSNNTIGGTNAGEGNVFSGNTSSGIWLSYGTFTVAGNIIGLQADGTSHLANNSQDNGVYITSANNTIGGTTSSHRNIISGNTYSGVSLGQSGADNNNIYGNYIGTTNALTQVTGSSQDYGVYIWVGKNNKVGGTSTGQANTIAYNTTGGVWVGHPTATGNAIRRNLIYSNSGLPIDLVSGGNTEKAAPVITSVTSTSISGTAVSGDYVEIYSNSVPNCTDAMVYIGQAYTSGGTWTLNGSFNTSHQFLANATPSSNNTSEFASPSASGTVNSSADTVISGDTVVLTLSGYSGNIQWQSKDSLNGIFEDISGATNATLTTVIVAANSNKKFFRALVGSAGCLSAISNEIEITIIKQPDFPKGCLIDACSPPTDACELVCNGGFEVGQIPTAISQLHYACGWGSPSAATPDLYSSNSIGSVNIPNTNMGFHQAHLNSNGMAGFYAKAPTNGGWYEYVYQIIRQPLIAGADYQYSFWVKHASGAFAQNIGFWAADYFNDIVAPSNVGTGIFPGFTGSGTAVTTTGWQNITGQIINASGNEDAIMIGNFGSNVTGSGNTSFYFLDDVSLKPIMNLTATASPSTIPCGSSSTLSVVPLLNPSNPTSPTSFISWTSSPSSAITCPTCPQTTVTPTVTTVYTVTVTYAPGCTKTATVTVNVTPNSTPPTFTVSEYYPCVGDNVNFAVVNPTPGVTYSWNFDDGTTSSSINSNVSHSFSNPGVYNVSLTNSGGCPGTSTQQIFVTPPNGCCYNSQFVANGTNSFDNLTISTGGTTHFTIANSPYKIKFELRILPGQTLIIDNGVIVEFGPWGRLIIENGTGVVNGARLEMGTNSKLTSGIPIILSACTGPSLPMWQGVQVWGAGKSTGTTSLRGRITMNPGSKIENAHNAILLGRHKNDWDTGFDPAFSGGMAVIDGAEFEANANNIVAVEFTLNSSIASVKNSKFNDPNSLTAHQLLDPGYLTGNSYIYPNNNNKIYPSHNTLGRTSSFVYLLNFRRAILNDNTFDNCETGVILNNATARISKVSAPLGNEFNNMQTAISGNYARGSIFGNDINGNTFENITGPSWVSLIAAKNDIIIGNNFNAQSIPSVKAISLNTCQSFIVNDNVITNFTEGIRVTSSASITNARATIGYSATGNTFNGCVRAIRSFGNNSNLQLHCNNHNPTGNYSGHNWENFGQLPQQGLLPIGQANDDKRPAGNKFDPNFSSSSNKQITSLNGQTYRYIMHSTAASGAPFSVIPIPNTNITTVPTGIPELSTSCTPAPSNPIIVKPKIAELQNRINDLYTELDSVISNIDANQTSALLSIAGTQGTVFNIDSTCSGNLSGNQIAQFINCSSLSDTVLISLIRRLCTMSDTVAKQILIPNSPVSDYVKPHLTAYCGALQYSTQCDLNAAQTCLTYRTPTRIKWEIQDAISEQAQLFDDLLNYYVDSISTDSTLIDSVYVLLEAENSFYAKHTLASTYAIEGNNSAAQNVLNSITPANTWEQNYVTLQTILLQLSNDSTTLFDADSTQIATIRAIAQQNEDCNLPSMQAQAALYILLNEPYLPCFEFSDSTRAHLMLNSFVEMQKTDYLGNNYPNPFNEGTSIPYYVPEKSNGYIQVMDMKGNLIGQQIVTPGHNVLVLDTEKWRAGVYFYSIVIDGSIKQTKRMVLIK